MIVIRIQAGLGNQMFQYAFAKSLLQSKVYFQFASPNRLAPFSIGFKKRSFISSFLRSMHFNLKHKLVSDPLWEPTNPNSIKDYSLLDGTWCYPQNFNKFKASLIEDFRIKSVSKQFLNARAYVLEKECCSIHVRRGDYLKPKAKLKYRTLDQDYYRLAMNYIEQSANVECYIVFTNDIDWCKSNLKSDKPLLYINELFKLTDYEELHVMALCKHNIIANSTFSWWAAYLNENAEKTVIKPRIWYTLDVAQHAYENKGLLSLEGSINL